MGDDNEEVSEVMKILKENGLLELPADARAEYISRTFDENGMEILRKAIKEDIYTFSHVPNLTDEKFCRKQFRSGYGIQIAWLTNDYR